MTKQLMHQNKVVAEISMSKTTKNISHVDVKNADLFPVVDDSDINSIRRWLLNRSSIINRKDILPLVRFYGEREYISENLCSLYDCYWLKDKDSPDSWEDISPFHQDLEEDSIFLSVIKPDDFEYFTPNSPNLTIAGKDPVFWYYNEDSGELGQLNLNAQRDMDFYKESLSVGVDILKPRTYLILSGYICTFTPVETSEEIERIPLGQLYLSVMDPEKSKKQNLEYCCEYYDIPNWESFIDDVLKFNRQTKTHEIDLLDIGVLRDAHSLKYIGMDRI